MKKIVIFLGILLIFILLILYFIPQFIAMDKYKNQLLTIISNKIDRQVQVDNMQLEIFPDIALILTNVTVSNPPNEKFSTPHILTLEKMRIKLKLLPLFKRKIKISEFTLVEPNIILEINDKDVPNWIFKHITNTSTPIQIQDKTVITANAESDSYFSIDNIVANNIQIKRGHFIYRDIKQNITHTLNDVNLQMDIANADTIAVINSNFKFKEHKFNLTTDLSSLTKIINAQQGNIEFTLTSKLLNLHHQGLFDLSQNMEYQGSISLLGNSLYKAINIFTPLEAIAIDLNKEFSLKTQFNLINNIVHLKDIIANFDDIDLNGDIKIASNQKKPNFSGTLNISDLNLDRHYANNTAGKANNAIAPTTANAQNTPINKQVFNWSKAPIDLDFINMLDMDMLVKTGAITQDKIKIGNSISKIAIQDGRLDLESKLQKLFDGDITIALNTTPTKDKINIANVMLDIMDINCFDIAADLMGSDRIGGILHANIHLNGQALSVHNFIKNATGKGVIELRDSVVRGLDLNEIIADVKTNFPQILATNPRKETKITNIYTDLLFNNGVANADIKIILSQALITGKGNVGLIDEKLDLAFTPPKIKDMVIPILVRGYLAKPTVAIDLVAVQKQVVKKLVDTHAERLKDEIQKKLGITIPNNQMPNNQAPALNNPFPPLFPKSLTPDNFIPNDLVPSDTQPPANDNNPASDGSDVNSFKESLKNNITNFLNQELFGG